MEEINEIVKNITNLSGKHNFQTIFSDWVTLMAMSIQNCCAKKDAIWKAREEKFLNITKKYTQEEIKIIFNLYPKLVFAFEREIKDYLGEIFMQLATMANKKIMGQCFTPFSVSMVAAKISYEHIKDSLYEPTCGSGGMIIATVKNQIEKGINYQERLKVIAQDLDNLCVYMTYVQLSLLGINAIVMQGDTLDYPLEEAYLKTPQDRIFRTPKNLKAF